MTICNQEAAVLLDFCWRDQVSVGSQCIEAMRETQCERTIQSQGLEPAVESTLLVGGGR